ncbi:MAG: hypothetical protein WCS96_01270 [Victivallales bacterium]
MIVNLQKNIRVTLQKQMEMNYSWLRTKAKEILSLSGHTAYNGARIWTPGYNELYNNRTYPRDFFYMADACGDLLTPDEIRGEIELFLRAQGSDGRIPNCVYIDGKTVNWLFDNSQFLVNLLYLYVERSGDMTFFLKHYAAFERAMAFLPLHPVVHLVCSRYDGKKMYGFNDTINIDGCDLFCSLLYYEASKKLSLLFDKGRMYDHREYWDRESARVQSGLKMLYNNREFYLSCFSPTGQRHVNVKPSVWGSAFSVYIEQSSEIEKQEIGGWLIGNYNLCVFRGQVRHLLKPNYWDDADCLPETYQNGGFWAAPFDWVQTVIRSFNCGLANQMLTDIMDDFQEYGINEVVNRSMGYLNRMGHLGNYSASLVPLKTFRRLQIPFHDFYELVTGKERGNLTVSSQDVGSGMQDDFALFETRDVTPKADSEVDDSEWSRMPFSDIVTRKWVSEVSDQHPWIQLDFHHQYALKMITFKRDNWSAGLSQKHLLFNHTGLTDMQPESIMVEYMDCTGVWNLLYADEKYRKLEAGENFVLRIFEEHVATAVRLRFKPGPVCLHELRVYATCNHDKRI